MTKSERVPSSERARQAAADYDRRQARRWKVFKEGQLVLPGRQSIPCVIRDISESGARLQVPSNTVLPETFVLFIKADEVMMPARRIWITLDQVGIRFVDR